MPPNPVTLPKLSDALHAARRRHDPDRALMVGLSGIDAAGKGWVAHRLEEALTGRGWRVALLNVDAWLNLPPVRFNPADPARHFYTHALRLEEFRATLLVPLRETRAVDAVAEVAEETATSFRRRRFEYRDIDIVLAEGIFLFKRGMRQAFDVSIWVECSFETALARALARAQEGLPPDETHAAYRTIYFPAQEHHARVDRPRDRADYLLPNDDVPSG